MEVAGIQKDWKAFIQGDHQAFKKLYKTHYHILIKFAFAYSGDRQLSDECLQDLFVKLWEKREGLNTHPSSVKNYLIRALKNTLINKIYKKKQEISLGGNEDLLIFNMSYIPDFMDSFSQIFSIEVQSIIKLLTEKQQEAIYLFYAEDYSYQELADYYQINIGAAYKLMYRALSSLQEHKTRLAPLSRKKYN